MGQHASSKFSLVFFSLVDFWSNSFNSWSLFWQNFTSSFFTYFLLPKNYKPKQNYLAQKDACKMLMKLTPGVNFINILQLNFLCKSAWRSFYLVTFWLFNIVWPQNIGSKVAIKCWWKWQLELTLPNFFFLANTLILLFPLF